MKKILSIALSALLLSGCVHKIDIQQGNILTKCDVQRLHPGMTIAQVQDIMGTPILINTFSDDRIDYVYTFKPGGGSMCLQYVTLIVRKGVVQEIKGNMYSTFIK